MKTRKLTGKSYAKALRSRLPKVGAWPLQSKGFCVPGSGESKAKIWTLGGGSPKCKSLTSARGLSGSSESM